MKKFIGFIALLIPQIISVLLIIATLVALLTFGVSASTKTETYIVNGEEYTLLEVEDNIATIICNRSPISSAYQEQMKCYQKEYIWYLDDECTKVFTDYNYSTVKDVIENYYDSVDEHIYGVSILSIEDYEKYYDILKDITFEGSILSDVVDSKNVYYLNYNLELETVSASKIKNITPVVKVDYEYLETCKKESTTYDTITLGGYTWTCVNVEDNKATYICDEVFHMAYKTSTVENGKLASDYKYSDIREYLNGEFYNSFTEEEKELIVSVTLNNSPTTTKQLNGYVFEDTEDKVFILSYDEYTAYKDNIPNCKDYALRLRTPDKREKNKTCAITGYDTNKSATGILSSSDVTKTIYGIRPCVVIDLNKTKEVYIDKETEDIPVEVIVINDIVEEEVEKHISIVDIVIKIVEKIYELIKIITGVIA